MKVTQRITSLPAFGTIAVTGKPNLSTRPIRSRRSHFDTRLGSVEMMISSKFPSRTASLTDSNGSAPPTIGPARDIANRNALTRALACGRGAPDLARTPLRACAAGRFCAVLSAALVMLALPFAACGGTGDDGNSPESTQRASADDGNSPESTQRASAENWNFEAGDLSGWRTVAAGGGAWNVYRDGATPPDPTDSDPNVPFAVPDPPEGKFAAVTDMSEAGRRILYRDIKLTGAQRLRLTLFYDNYVGAEFSAPRTLELFDGRRPNQQFRIDVMDPSAPIDAMSGRAVLATVFRTAAGDPAQIGPTTKTFDLSRWAGRTIRLRFAQVDNRGPLRAGIDDVRLERAS
jgi:hypothetical protein